MDHNKSLPIEILKATFVGEKFKKSKRTWSVLELELPGKNIGPLRVKGFAWGGDSIHYAIGDDASVAIRNASLTTKSKSTGFPVAMINAEIRCEDDQWIGQEIYIAPIWDDLISL
ncbi:MAG: hypothetical protein AAF497_20460 [Planctomycetota bacterium]